ncbi:MAG: thiamine-phosphate kinase, partial [Endomicrobium sp.]|nr:thiamine-phosphate kinase [Endomicrobium sp.]
MLILQVFANVIIAYYYLNNQGKANYYFDALGRLSIANPQDYIKRFKVYLKNKGQKDLLRSKRTMGMKNKNISSISEFGLIGIIKKQFATAKNNKNIIVGIGDDSFCFKSGKNNICITKDMLIEDVHFKKDWITPQNLGEKAIEVNVSDIAAMGNVKPEYALIGLGLPPKTSEIFVKNLSNGFKKACDKYRITVVGGDTAKSDKITISVTVVGLCKEKVIKRNGANEGDIIGVTNTFGDAGAGVTLLYK